MPPKILPKGDGSSKRPAEEPAPGDGDRSEQSLRSSISRTTARRGFLYEKLPDENEVAAYLKIYKSLAGDAEGKGGLLEVAGQHRIDVITTQHPIADGKVANKRNSYFDRVLKYDNFKTKKSMLLYTLGLSPTYQKVALNLIPDDGVYEEAKELLDQFLNESERRKLSKRVSESKKFAGDGPSNLPTITELYRQYEDDALPKENKLEILRAVVLQFYILDFATLRWRYFAIDDNISPRTRGEYVVKFNEVKDNYLSEYRIIKTILEKCEVMVDPHILSALEDGANLQVAQAD